jgi:TAT (twin-arginine translocation) pathway signal sequence
MDVLSRRSFLGWTAAGAAAILTPSIVRPRPVVFDMGPRGVPWTGMWHNVYATPFYGGEPRFIGRVFQPAGEPIIISLLGHNWIADNPSGESRNITLT